jgi:hypothetical protein
VHRHHNHFGVLPERGRIFGQREIPLHRDQSPVVAPIVTAGPFACAGSLWITSIFL